MAATAASGRQPGAVLLWEVAEGSVARPLGRTTPPSLRPAADPSAHGRTGSRTQPGPAQATPAPPSLSSSRRRLLAAGQQAHPTLPGNSLGVWDMLLFLLEQGRRRRRRSGIFSCR